MTEGREHPTGPEDNEERILKEIGSITVSTARAASVNTFQQYFGANSRGPFLIDERGEKRALWSARFEKLVKSKKEEPLRPGVIRVLELQHDATGKEIAAKLGKAYQCSFADMAYLLAQHSTGGATPLHVGGWANLFFVGGNKPEIVQAFMNLHGREWCFESFPFASDLKWMKGVRVLARAPGSYSSTPDDKA